MIKKYYYFKPSIPFRSKFKVTSRILLIVVLGVITVGLLTYKGAYALFTNTATSVGNTFSAALSFGSESTSSIPTPTPTPDSSDPKADLSLQAGVSSIALGEEFDMDATFSSHGLFLSVATLNMLYPKETFQGLSVKPNSSFPIVFTNVISNGTASATFGKNPPVTSAYDGTMVTLRFRPIALSASPALFSFDTGTTILATNVTPLSTNVVGAKNPFLMTVVAPPKSVVINEIMWMGSGTSTADEWIELHNTTGSPIDLSGWKIVNLAGAAPNNVFEITSGTIAANGYFLISNYASTSASSILNVTADLVNTSLELNNNGEQLVLKDSSNNTIDVANITGAWFAGSNSSPKKSMERTDPPGNGAVSGSWKTASSGSNLDAGRAELATPKAVNSL